MSTAQPLGAPREDLAAAAVGIEPVPAHHRVLGAFDYFVLWADLGVGLLVLAAGSYLVPGLGFGAALAAIVLGTLIGTAMLGMAGVVGSKYGVPSMVSLRPSFGQRGSYLPSLANLLQLIGFGAFEIFIMAQASSRLSGQVFGMDSYPLWVVAWGVVAVLLGLGGPLVVVRQWLKKAGIWLVLAMAAYMGIYALGHASPDILSRPGDGSLTFAQGIDLVVVMPVSWLPLVADYNRFARGSRSSFAGTVGGYALANAGFYALGLLLVLVLPAGDLVSSIMLILFGGAGLVLLLVDETDNAFADIYSGAISIKNVLPAWSTRGLVVAVGAVCTAIALAVDLNAYVNFLYLVGSLFVSLFGVLLADFFVLRRRRYEMEDLYPADGRGTGIAGVNLAALAAWGAGIAVYLLEINFVHWLGGTLPSLAASFFVYLALQPMVGRLPATARAAVTGRSRRPERDLAS